MGESFAMTNSEKRNSENTAPVAEVELASEPSAAELAAVEAYPSRNARSLAELTAKLSVIVGDREMFSAEIAELRKAERSAYRSAIDELMLAYPGSREIVAERSAS
jgi:hypothetical protein